MAIKKELFDGVSFNGNCEEFLRELVSLCLAYLIRDRLDVQYMPLVDMPHYKRRNNSR